MLEPGLRDALPRVLGAKELDVVANQLTARPT